MPRDPFPRVREAREALRQKALDLFEKYLAIIEEARSKGEFEVALEHTRWLLEHMPNEAGERLIDPSAAKPKEIEAPRSNLPAIQIGIAMGGIPTTPALPEAKIIDVTPEKKDE